MGGATPGARSQNVLAAIGAKVRVDVIGRDGAKRSIIREVGATLSFGGNSFVQHIDPGDAATADAVSVTWPASGTTQTLRDVAADRSLVITEEAASVPPPR